MTHQSPDQNRMIGWRNPSIRIVRHRSFHTEFLNWVAYSRDLCPDITEDQRRTCPVCEHMFVDRRSMLQHVPSCAKLPNGYYRCISCGKKENIGRYHTNDCKESSRGKNHFFNGILPFTGGNLFVDASDAMDRQGAFPSGSVPWECIELPSVPFVELDGSDYSVELATNPAVELPATRPKCGGRPRIAWNASRRRKLVRLYLMTGLKVKDIAQVLSSDDFKPRTRNVQTQLGELIPDIEKKWRMHRPHETDKGVHRLAQVNHCRALLRSRKKLNLRRKARLNTAATQVSRTVALTPANSSDHATSNILYDPLRHFEDKKEGETTSCIIPQLSQWYSNLPSDTSRTETLSEYLEEGRFSDKEVFTQEVTSTDTVVAESVESVPKPSCDQSMCANGQTTETPGYSSHGLSAMDSTPHLSRSGTVATENGGASIRSLSTRVSSRLSRSLRHVNSVLSATNSWASGLAYTSSFSTNGRRSSTKTRSSGWEHEFLHWDKLEESAPALAEKAIHCHEISLQSRPCCNYSEQIPAPDAECTICGTKQAHHLARSSKTQNPTYVMSSLDTDRFGNTTLHHAAAAGNLLVVEQFLKTFGRIPKAEPFSRNSSGETFLHVLRFDDPKDFGCYLEILRSAKSLGFSFATLDDHGMSIPMKFLSFAGDWEVDVVDLIMLQEILQAQPPTNQLSPQLADRALVRDILKSDPISESALMTTLKSSPLSPQAIKNAQRNFTSIELHMRDARGYTPLAVAASLGICEMVSFLLGKDANPNSRSYRGTSVVALATSRLALAQHHGEDELYAKILSCVVLLIDHGAKPMATAYDEFYTKTPAPQNDKRSIRDRILKTLPFNKAKHRSESSTAALRRNRQVLTLDTLREEPVPKEKKRRYRERRLLPDGGQTDDIPIVTPGTNDNPSWALPPSAKTQKEGVTNHHESVSTSSSRSLRFDTAGNAQILSASKFCNTSETPHCYNAFSGMAFSNDAAAEQDLCPFSSRTNISSGSGVIGLNSSSNCFVDNLARSSSRGELQTSISYQAWNNANIATDKSCELDPFRSLWMALAVEDVEDVEDFEGLAQEDQWLSFLPTDFFGGKMHDYHGDFSGSSCASYLASDVDGQMWDSSKVQTQSPQLQNRVQSLVHCAEPGQNFLFPSSGGSSGYGQRDFTYSPISVCPSTSNTEATNHLESFNGGPPCQASKLCHFKGNEPYSMSGVTTALQQTPSNRGRKRRREESTCLDTSTNLRKHPMIKNWQPRAPGDPINDSSGSRVNVLFDSQPWPEGTFGNISASTISTDQNPRRFLPPETAIHDPSLPGHAKSFSGPTSRRFVAQVPVPPDRPWSEQDYSGGPGNLYDEKDCG